MKVKLSIRLMAVCLLLSPLLQAQDYAALKTVFFDPAVEQHDLDAHAANLIAVIERNPASAEAWVALQRALEIGNELASTRPLYEALRKLASDGFKRCGANADAFVAAWKDNARRFETDPTWQKEARRWRGIAQASWIGPFADSGSPAHDDVFDPEVTTDFRREYAGPFGPLRWSAVRDDGGLNGGIDLGSQARYPGRGYYVAFSITSAQEREVVIKPEFNGPGRVWLGGHPIADIDTRAAHLPDQWLTVTLQRGQNLLLVKISSLSMLTVHLRTPQGQPVEGLVFEAPQASTLPSPVLPGAAPPSSTRPVEAAALISAQPQTVEQVALTMLALALACRCSDMDAKAEEQVDGAWAALPDSPVMALYFLDSIERGSLYSRGERRRIEAEVLDKLVAAGCVPAMLKRARTLTDDDRFNDAADILQRAQKAAPGNWRVLLAMAALYERANWPAEQRAALDAARALAPAALPVLSQCTRFWYGRSNLAGQVELARAMLTAMPADMGANSWLVRLLQESSQTGEALKVARAAAAFETDGDYAKDQLIRVLLANGKLAEVCELYDKRAASTASPENEYNAAAKACLQLGDEARAVQYLAKAVAASPAEYQARRQMRRMRGEAEDFWTKYAMPMEEVRKLDVSREQFPRADSAVLLDECVKLVNEDGSAVSFVRQVRKILTQEGVDARGKGNVGGELLRARTTKPDGTELEPITYGSGLEFPGLTIGSIIDLCWLAREGANPWRNIVGEQFFFNDNELAEPFAVSRYVLITPADMQLGVRAHNLNDGEYTRQAEGGSTVHTWDVRRPSHPQAELFAPSPLETIPWIEIKQPRDWRPIVRSIAEQGLSHGRKITALVRQRAGEIVAGAQGDEARARAIYAWVNENLTTQGDAANPNQALKALAGNREELFAALCLAAGVKLGFAAIGHAPEFRNGAGDLPVVNWDAPRPSDFDLHLFVVAGKDGNLFYVDLSDRLRPFGALPVSRSRAPVILWRDGRYEVAHLPGVEPGSDRFENQLTIRLNADGSATVEGTIAVFGEGAWGRKEQVRTASADDVRQQLEREVASIFPGLELDKCSTPGVGVPGTPYVRKFEGKVAKLAVKQDGGLAMDLPVEKLGQLLSQLVSTPARSTAIVMPFNFHQRDEIRIAPPEGWRFKAIPQDLLHPTAPVAFSTCFGLKDGELVIRRLVDVGPGRIEPVSYAQLTQQVKKISESEETRLELEKAP